MLPGNLGNYAKGLIALEGILAQALVLGYGNDKWTPIITGALAAILLILVPNTPKPTSAPVMPQRFPETMPSKDKWSPAYTGQTEVIPQRMSDLPITEPPTEPPPFIPPIEFDNPNAAGMPE